jgi:YXWGXW repeat-containing protein
MLRQALRMSLLSVALLTGCSTEFAVRGSFPAPLAVAEVAPVPPPPRYEVIPVAPSREHVWVGGHWVWRPERHRHVWVPGGWHSRG